MNADDVYIESVPEIHLGAIPLQLRVIFNPKKFRNCHNIEIKAFDSSRRVIDMEVTRWGTKMRISLLFSDEHVDGIARIVVDDGGGPTDICRFWFVR